MINWNLEKLLQCLCTDHEPIRFGDRCNACEIEYVRKLPTTGLCSLVHVRQLTCDSVVNVALFLMACNTCHMIVDINMYCLLTFYVRISLSSVIKKKKLIFFTSKPHLRVFAKIKSSQKIHSTVLLGYKTLAIIALLHPLIRDEWPGYIERHNTTGIYWAAWIAQCS